MLTLLLVLLYKLNHWHLLLCCLELVQINVFICHRGFGAFMHIRIASPVFLPEI
jgi:hypothetical protein